MTEKKEDQNKLVEERRNKLLSMREDGFNYPKSRPMGNQQEKR